MLYIFLKVLKSNQFTFYVPEAYVTPFTCR